MGSPSTAGVNPTERVRLHITPFNRDLADKLLPAPLRSQASGLSFHAVQTFAERGFGYVELPTMEAQKLKKKFNGTTLKGTKIRIEEAKPEKKRKIDQTQAPDEEKSQKRVKKEKKKRENGVLLGHELEESRIVKRGWSDDTGARKGKKDNKDGVKTLKDKKMRFKTTLPPVASATKTKEQREGKKSKDGKGKPSKAGTVIKEFSKTIRLSAQTLRASEPRAVMYEDGKGWLDQDGNVLEAEPIARTRQREQRASASLPSERSEQAIATPGSVSESNTDSEAVDSAHVTTSNSGSAATSSVSSSDSDDLPSSDDEEDDASSDISAQSSETASQSVPESTLETPVKEVHPLEALYKRPKPAADGTVPAKRPAPIDTSFSFFGPGNDEDAGTDELDRQLPQTPHTKKDLEWRSIRSAAPTPDTAAAGKRFSFALANDSAADEDEDGDEDVAYHSDTYTPIAATAKKNDEEQKEESEFRKWFYENRGDLNRGWKKRRREERKLERQRENRRLSRRVA